MPKKSRLLRTILILALTAAVCIQYSSVVGADKVQVNAPLPKPTKPVPPLDSTKPKDTQLATFGLG